MVRACGHKIQSRSSLGPIAVAVAGDQLIFFSFEESAIAIFKLLRRTLNKHEGQARKLCSDITGVKSLASYGSVALQQRYQDRILTSRQADGKRIRRII